MQKIHITSFIYILSFVTLSAQYSPIGIWKTIDDDDQKAKSHIEIFEKEGKLFGKVVKLLEREDNVLCEKCKGDKKDQPIVGMEVIWDMKPDGDEWKGGKVMDPKNGKEYKCKIKINVPDVLEVRGYKGFSLLGRTQKWYRLKK
jgi:uncharacterized protein (DUF2147 family)